MSRIRIVGRARGGRCVYCHDSLSSEVDRCPECQASWHQDCAPEGATRCPTIGCAGPAPAHTSRPAGRRDRARHAPRLAGRPPAWTVDRPRPGPDAVFWPLWRLVLSGVFNACVALLMVTIVLWAITNPHALWDFLIHGKRHSLEPVPVAIGKGLCFGTFVIGFGAFSAMWLLRLPAVWREVNHLLARTDPALMELTVWSTGSGKQRRTHGKLEGPASGPHARVTIDLQLGGIVTPGWLSRSRSRESVLVYGLPPPGPYIIEFRDGDLALVNPD